MDEILCKKEEKRSQGEVLLRSGQADNFVNLPKKEKKKKKHKRERERSVYERIRFQLNDGIKELYCVSK